MRYFQNGCNGADEYISLMEKNSRSPSRGSSRSSTSAKQGRTSTFAFTTFEPTGSESGAPPSSGRGTTSSSSSFRSRTSAGQSWRSRPGPSSPARSSTANSGAGGGAEATSPSLFQAVVGTSATSAASSSEPRTFRGHCAGIDHETSANDDQAARASKSSASDNQAARASKSSGRGYDDDNDAAAAAAAAAATSFSLRRTSSFSTTTTTTTSGIFSASSSRSTGQEEVVADGGGRPGSDLDAGRAFAALSDFLVVSETRMGSGDHEDADADANADANVEKAAVREVDWDEDWSLKNAVVFSSSHSLSAATSGNLLHRAACENHVYDSKRSRGRGRRRSTQDSDSLQALLRYYVSPSDNSSFMIRLLRQQVVPSNKARPDDIQDLNDLIRDRVLEWGV